MERETDTNKVTSVSTPPVDAQVALWVSMVLFVPGLFAPFMTLERFLMFENSLSIARTISLLWSEGKFVLWAVVLLFSVLVPVAKLILEAFFCFCPNFARIHSLQLRWLLTSLAQFSMAEIFVAAIIITAMKIDVIAEAHLHVGIYLLLGSVLAGLWVSWRLEVRTTSP